MSKQLFIENWLRHHLTSHLISHLITLHKTGKWTRREETSCVCLFVVPKVWIVHTSVRVRVRVKIPVNEE